MATQINTNATAGGGSALATMEKQRTVGMGGNFVMQPKFMFGFKGDVRSNLHFLDQDIVIYPCGHNIVFYRQDDRSQRFIPGLEGSEGITAMALSHNRKYLAVCEKSTKAVCVVYNVGKLLDAIKEQTKNKKAGSTGTYDQNAIKNKRILFSSDVDCAEFVSADFCRNEDKKMLVTMTGTADCKVIVWNWDKQKCLGFTDVSGLNPGCIVRQVSFCPTEHSILLVTGKDVFKYYKIQENNSLKPIHQQAPKKEADISTNYICHAWLHDNKFVVCTDLGQIMLFEQSGDYKLQIIDNKRGNFPINSVLPYCIGHHDGQQASGGKSSLRSGFIVAGDSGMIRVFVKSDSASQPYKRVEPEKDDLMMTNEYERTREPAKLRIYNDVMYQKVTNMTLSPKEDQLLFSTESNQIISIKINLDKPTDELWPYDYLVTSFHRKAIQGLDICVKKQLIATCSVDRSVRIWSYNSHNNQFKLELCQDFKDQEAYSLALHPSGFHVVIGFQECVKMMNILDHSLVPYKEIKTIKNCREIQFSHGGQYFACQSGANVLVYKFYTAESPTEFFFKGQNNNIRNITWFEEDTGFVTSGQDAGISVWDLYTREKGEPGTDGKAAELKQGLPRSEFRSKSTCFNSVAVHKGSDGLMVMYAAGNDRSIREVFEAEKGKYRDNRFEENTSYSQILCAHQRRFLIAGTCDQNRPGAIQILRHNPEGPFLERILEVQAHCKPVERLRLSFDNTKCFSVGQDGVIAIFGCTDREPRRKDKDGKEVVAALPSVTLSDEILIEKDKRDQLQAEIQRLKNDIRNEKSNNENQIKMQMEQKRKEITELKNLIANEKAQFDQEFERLEQEKQLEEQKNDENLAHLDRLHEEELRLKRHEFEVKQSADIERYTELERLKEKQANDFSNKISELFLLQEKQFKDMQVENTLAQKQKDQEIKQLEEKINDLKGENEQHRKKIEDHAWDEIDKIKERNKEELKQIIDLGTKSKSELTGVTGQYKTKKARKEQLLTEIRDKQTKLTDLINLTKDLEANIVSQRAELQERESTIKDKDKRIYDLKKKTQELEKFKFVLDYKIKELKRDIDPRNQQIANLGEQTNQMKQEVQHFTRVNNNLLLIVEDLRMRQHGLLGEQNELRKTINEQEADKGEFIADVQDVLLQIENHKKLKKGLVRLYKKYVLEEDRGRQSGGDSLQQSYTNKRRHLEDNLTHLRDTMKKTQDENKSVRKRFMKENVMLIEEINSLVQQKHQKQRDISILDQERNAHSNVEEDRRVQEYKMQQMMIEEIKEQILQFEAQNDQLRGRRATNARPLPLESQEQAEAFNSEIGEGIAASASEPQPEEFPPMDAQEVPPAEEQQPAEAN